MDLHLTSEQRAFRDDLREFLKRELTADVWKVHRDTAEQGMWTTEFTKAFRCKLGEAGYIGMSWPKEYGGGGRDRIFQTILWDEMEYHRAPGIDRSVTYIPNAVMAFGSPAQKADFLPRMVRGEVSWFVGYSEPDAGSDLASLKTRAVEDGDYFIITGQKAFSSDAHMADYAWLATRTATTGKKHEGLTIFIVDMKSPGVTISEHPTLAGWTHHAVNFDGVRVHKSMMVGERDQGWKIVMGAIDFERAALAAPGLTTYQLDQLLGWCTQEREGERLIDDPLVREDLVRLAIESDATRLMSYWLASLHAKGLRPQHETSLALLVKRETARQLDIKGMELLGAFAPLRAGSPAVELEGDIELEYRDHLYFQFAAGGFDITRNVIATRGLGLPR